jgi:signal transduction histidine kinase
LLRDRGDEQLSAAVREDLEVIRREQKMDILNLLAPDGTVVLRTRFPYNKGDSLSSDPMIKQVILTQQGNAGDVILSSERLDVEGIGLLEWCLALGEPTGMLSGAAVPVFEGGGLIGIIQMGSLLNGAVEEVDRIRDDVFENEYYEGKPVVFENEYYEGKPVGTATIFMGDLRISTNVQDSQGRRAIGTRVSRDVAEHVLEKGLSWTGRAFVVDTWYLSRYDPIKDPDGNIIGMFYVGELEQKYLDLRTRAVVSYLLVIFAGMMLALLMSFFMIRGILRPIQMLGFVAHELKNPLASAIMSLYTVKDGYLGEISPAQRKSLESVAQSLDYFQDMVKNYLDLSRLEKGELEVHKSQVSLYTDVVAPVIEGLERALQERRMVLENHISEDMVLNVDGNLLRIVYDNLLSNAIKYGREGGAIELDARESDSQVTLSVRNDGEGIPPEKMSLLFKKFSRLDSPEYAKKKGTGLGLYICKEVVEKQGGEIRADSKVGE